MTQIKRKGKGAVQINYFTTEEGGVFGSWKTLLMYPEKRCKIGGAVKCPKKCQNGGRVQIFILYYMNVPQAYI